MTFIQNSFLDYDDFSKSKTTILAPMGKNCVITGGCGRIGSVFTTYLLECGSHVACLSRSKENFEKFKNNLPIQLQKNIYWIYIDLGDPQTIVNALKEVTTHFPQIDILVNNASGSNRGKHYHYDVQTFDKELWSVFGGSIFFTEKILKVMRLNKKGLVINVGSLWGMQAPDFKTYLDLDIGPTALLACGKAAIHQYTRYLASREAEYGIRVNSLIPGFFPRKGPIERADYMEEIHSRTPLGRIGVLNDLISPIAFLLSEGATFYTGQSLVVDGGYSVW